jgi:LPXTG-motif cell wall-anchored protein
VVNFAPRSGGEARDVAAGQEVTATSEGLGETETFDVAAESELWQKPAANNPVKADETGKETMPTKFIVGGIIAAVIIVIGFALGMKRRKRKSEV